MDVLMENYSQVTLPLYNAASKAALYKEEEI